MPALSRAPLSSSAASLPAGALHLHRRPLVLCPSEPSPVSCPSRVGGAGRRRPRGEAGGGQRGGDTSDILHREVSLYRIQHRYTEWKRCTTSDQLKISNLSSGGRMYAKTAN
eukprot:6229123-Prymnesium_polylepis.1